MSFLNQVTVTNLLIILQLVIIEGLLSFDNALALAALVKSKLKDPKDQKHALRWGIWGAYVFRILVIFIGVWLMEHEWVKLIAGVYLVQMALSELFFKKAELEEEEIKAFSWIKLSPVWATVVAVEIMDIMFSLDSIGVALAISNIKWVLIAGAMLGILLMRVAAQFFIVLIEKFPILTKTAFVLVGFAGINICLKIKELPLGFMNLTIDKAIPEHAFLGMMFTIFFGSLILNKIFPNLGRENG